MIVGIDVHKRTHAAALLDGRGREIGALGFANSAEGMRRLCAWLDERGAGEAVVGVESPAGYGRLLVASLEAAGHEVLNVPAWRTHRERRRHGLGKTDPGDAIAVAQVVLRKRAELGPALEPELVRALAPSCSGGASSATAPRRSNACGPTGIRSTPSARRGSPT